MNCGDIEELAPLHLSGELEEERRELFLAHLRQCRSCAGEIERQIAMDARIREAAFAEVPDAAAIEWSVHRRIVRERRFAVAALAAGVVFAALLGYRALRPEAVTRLFTDAALDHRLEVMEHQPRRWRTDAAEISKLADRFELANVEALAPAGYRLEHAKMCGIDGQPALHLVYTNGAQEYSVYVRRSAAGANGKIHAVSVGSEHLASVRGGRLEAVIATGGSSGECLEYARFAMGLL